MLSLAPAELNRLRKLLTPRLNEFIPHLPTPKQAAFLLTNCREALYGGAAGGGKSDALLMAALQYVDVPGYAAMLFRRTFKDLSLPGSLMTRAEEWLRGTSARWDDEEKTWHFPSGATLTFGYLESEKDKFRYQSAEFQFVGFDELTQFTETQYRYLFSRLRRLKGVSIPIRMRSATNPGGIGGPWVYQRFIVEGRDTSRIFISARLSDNPFLDQDEYVLSLSELDPVTREQLLNGDWEIRDAGGKFKRGWFSRFLTEMPVGVKMIRFWDLAATEAKPGKDPDWTVGTLATVIAGIYYFGDVVRFRGSPKEVEDRIKQTAELDKMRYGNRIEIWIEQEGGSSGKITLSHFTRNVLKGFTVYAKSQTQSKELRANPVSSAAEAGNIVLIRGPWVTAWLEEFELFPAVGVHDDQVDSASGAFERLNLHKPRKQAKSLSWAGGNNQDDD